MLELAIGQFAGVAGFVGAVLDGVQAVLGLLWIVFESATCFSSASCAFGSETPGICDSSVWAAVSTIVDRIFFA